MALAAVGIAMDMEEQKDVHPFFFQARNNQHAERAESPEDDIAEAPQEPIVPTGKENKVVKRKGRGPGRPRRKEAAQSDRKIQPSLELFTKAAHTPNSLSIDAKDKLSAAVPFDEDPNFGRRKRRKTVSPERGLADHVLESPLQTGLAANGSAPETTWHDQLHAAAEVEVPRQSTETSDPLSERQVDLNAPGSIPSLPPVAAPCENSLHENPPQDTGQQDRIDDVRSRANGEPQGAAPAKQRKMLRINASGRFSSPPSNQPPSPVKQVGKRGRRGKNAKQQDYHALVIIKYGTEETSKARISHAIEEILSGRKRLSKLNPTVKPTEPPKPVGPPKATHPFFLGKTAPREQEGAESHDGKVETAQEPPSGPKKSACTPGKLRAEMKRTHDQVSFQGFGVRHTNMVKHPGLREPPWPSKDTAHVRDLPQKQVASELQDRDGHDLVKRSYLRKRKEPESNIPPHEHLISVAAREIPSLMEEAIALNQFAKIRMPTRLLTTGHSIREMVARNLYYDYDGGMFSSQGTNSATHPALLSLWNSIENTMTPFDQGKCETQCWTQKYAPKSAEQVLTPGKEAAILKDWLRSLAVTAVDSGLRDVSTALRPTGGKQAKEKPAKKKRKKANDLDDFIVDEEEDEMDELSEPEDLVLPGPRNSQKRALASVVSQNTLGTSSPKKLKNAVLLSGPHGSGKTATVYAVAKELGFEVFEINPSSRRSGKDILDRVGDMSENHLVHHAADAHDRDEAESNEERLDNAVQKDLESGRQGVMTSFFKSGNKKRTLKPKSGKRNPEQTKAESSKAHQQKHQRQSLILLEEVDILFEEDKQFWLTVSTLVMQSKRPVIMTCNDEYKLPAMQLPLHAILRLLPPSTHLATDYLLLLAANEGHIVERDAISALYTSKDYDLRASIMDLDFWCQISVGDCKGGLEWIYQRWPPGKDVDEHGRILRVASKDTYRIGMGWLGQDILSSNSCVGFDRGHELLLEMWEDWHVDMLPDVNITTDVPVQGTPQKCAPHDPSTFVELREMEYVLESLSCSDIYSRVGLPTGRGLMEILDATQPPMTEKSKASYIEGYPLLQVDPLADYSNFDTQVATSTALSLQRIVAATSTDASLQLYCQSSWPPADCQEQTFIKHIINHKENSSEDNKLTRVDFSAALDPLAEPPTSALVHASVNQLTASSFDRTFHIITEDLAPYVRSICAYDMALETQRLRLSNLLSVGGTAKRQRTTRASRSALEGGSRESTRRERWFDKTLNLAMVMKTGGEGWAGMGSRAMEELESKASATGSMTASSQMSVDE